MRTIRSFLALTVFALVIVACSGSSAQVLSTVGSAVGDTSSTAAPVPAAEPAAGAGASQSGSSDGTAAVPDDAKIIRTGTIDLEVRDVPTALRTARDAIGALGGYIGASTTSNKGDQPSASITYRIPADRWEQALDSLRGLNGQTTKVVQEQTEAVEVTSQVVDLDARIKNLRASETALQAIAAQATKISDVLEVEAQLTATRGQIEELTAQLKDLNDRAGFATLTATFNVPVVAVDVAAKGWEPKTVVDEAAASMISILQNLATAGIWFVIVWLPIFLVLGVLVAIGAWVARRVSLWRRRVDLAPPAPPAAPMASEG
jgi:hypothetical protein